MDMSKDLLDKCIEFKIDESMIRFISKIEKIYYKLAQLEEYSTKYCMSINEWIKENTVAIGNFQGLTDREKFIYVVGFLSGNVLNNFLESDLSSSINICQM